MMAYKPSLEDLSESSSYTPSLEDLDDEPKSASQAILSQIEESQQAQPQQQRTPQMQEEFSNPTMWPGFSDLPKEEQLRRIAYSQFDPANEASGGRYVPGGTYESDPARMMASVLPTLAVPELRAGWPVVRGLANALTRVGAGTLGNIAYQAPNIKSKEDLVNVAIQSGALNALLEGATLPLRGAARLAEIFNPLKYTANKAAQIKNEFTASKAVTDEMYRPINEEYNDFPVTLTPKNYLEERVGSLGLEGALGPHSLLIGKDNIWLDFYTEKFALAAGIRRIKAKFFQNIEFAGRYGPALSEFSDS